MLVQAVLLLPLATFNCLPAAQAPFDGRWHGPLVMQDGQRIDTFLEATEVDGNWVLRITQVGENRFHQPILNSRIDGSSVSLDVIVDERVQIWSGQLGDDHSTFSGSILVDGDIQGSFQLVRKPGAVDLDTAVTWSGSVIVPGRDFETVRLHLAREGGHWICDVDLPDRHFSNHPAQVSEAGTTLVIDLPLAIQVRLISPTPLDSEQAPEQVMGAWREGSTSSAMFLRRQVGDTRLEERTRPQTPRPPLPYEQRHEVVAHPIGHHLGVTMAMPRSDQLVPAVVLVSGLGNRDRDDEVEGHRFQAVWADALARRGIASVRFDHRGVGESTTPSTLETTTLSISHVSKDVRHLVEWLSGQQGVDPSAIGIIGWGEGGFVAMSAAAGLSREVAYIALLSTPGVQLGEIAKHQLFRELSTVPVDPERARDVLTAHGILVDVARDPEASTDELRELVIRYLQARNRLLPGDERPVSPVLTSEMMRAYATEEARRNLRFHPAMILPRLRCPVLALGGSADQVVPSGEHLPLIQAAVQRTGGEVDVVEIDGVNNRLQPVTVDRPRGLAQIRATVDPRALRAVTDWIHAVVGPPRPAVEAGHP